MSLGEGFGAQGFLAEDGESGNNPGIATLRQKNKKNANGQAVVA